MTSLEKTNVELIRALELLINRASKVPYRYFGKREVEYFRDEMHDAREALAKAKGEAA